MFLRSKIAPLREWARWRECPHWADQFPLAMGSSLCWKWINSHNFVFFLCVFTFSHSVNNIQRNRTKTHRASLTFSVPTHSRGFCALQTSCCLWGDLLFSSHFKRNWQKLCPMEVEWGYTWYKSRAKLPHLVVKFWHIVPLNCKKKQKKQLHHNHASVNRQVYKKQTYFLFLL